MLKRLYIIVVVLAIISVVDKAMAQNVYAAHSLLARGEWLKIAINETGMYRITPMDNSRLQGADISNIAMFGSTGGMLSMSNSVSHPDDLELLPVEIVDENNDGIFDGNDCILFYAEGPSVWRYVDADGRYEYNMNPYANYNYYFLTTSLNDTLAKTVPVSHTQTDSKANIEYCTAVALIHEDKVNTHGGGQIWVADKFTSSVASRTYSLTLPTQPQDGTVLARYAFVSLSESTAQMDMATADTRHQHNFSNGNSYQTFKETFTSTSRDVALTCTYRPRESGAMGYIDYIELNAQVPATFGGGQATLRYGQQSNSGSTGNYVVSCNATNVKVWDVTDLNHPYILNPSSSTDGKIEFTARTDTPRTFVLFTNDALWQPVSIEPLANQDIHGSDVPQMVIVTHADYVGQANALADLHLVYDGLSSMVVTQEEVFNEFSSGRPDPVAIRQMMRCLRQKAGDSDTSAPRYLLLIGKGTYDNRDIMGAHQSTVITYQTPTSFDDEGAAYPSDDVYGYLDSKAVSAFEGTMTVGIGRLPAKSVSEATHMLDKIEGYITRRDLTDSTARGDWRNYVALLADDADPSAPGDTNFASDSEITARLIKDRYPHFNIDRIYADSYVQQSGADGSYYPDVNNALRQRMNYGCLLLNYIGHGSSSYIGTERYMQFSDIEQYSNTDRLAFFVTSTCTFGKYDQVDALCGAEVFMLANAAGVGIVSASRPIHHIQRFNTSVCINALDPANTIGDALRIAKNTSYASHCIALLGDPALHLSIPRNEVVVTHINGQPVDASRTDSAQVLSRVTVRGEIRGPSGQRLEGFDGTIFPIVFDREVHSRTLANDNDSTEVEFMQQKNVLYKGRERVKDGRFEYSFIVPRDVAYQYDYAKLSHYAHGGTTDATGQYSNMMFGGFNDAMVIGEIYPTVKLYIGDTNFRNGGLTNETPTLIALLWDSVGINAAGSGIGHDITATIDGNPYSTVTLNDFYEPDINDSRGGTVRYTLGKLDNGQHSLTVRCWNIFNYSASATVAFNVANDRTALIGQVAAAPNPSRDRTTLRVEHNFPGAVANSSIEIYDMCGQLVRQATPTGDGNVLTWDWDFTSTGGSLMPKGIYVARITVTNNSGESLSAMTKIVRN